MGVIRTAVDQIGWSHLVKGGVQTKLYMEDSKQSINRIYVYLIKQDTTQVKLIPN
jgi:hypothetical protein